MRRIAGIALACFLTMSLSALAQTPVEIKLVQEKLAKYGAGTADGAFGNKTRAAIKAYQRDWQLPETGEITADLIARLKREHAATKSQWFKVSNQDCVVWNDQPNAQETAMWSGGCVAGKASGSGMIEWAYVQNGDTKRSTYQGAYQDGKQHGQGMLTSASGDRYEGEFQDGEWHGRGVVTWANGDRYEGAYQDGKRHGQGVYTFASGDRYEGEWKDGNYHGQGMFTWANGDRYEGQWHDHKPHGRGTFITAEGEREDRRWKRGCSTLKDARRWLNTTQEACGF